MRLDLRKEKLPYGDRAMVVTKPSGPVSYAVVCDAPIDEASACIPMRDTAVTMSTNLSEDRKPFYSTWCTVYRGAIRVFVFSRQEIHIQSITPSEGVKAK